MTLISLILFIMKLQQLNGKFLNLVTGIMNRDIYVKEKYGSATLNFTYLQYVWYCEWITEWNNN